MQGIFKKIRKRVDKAVSKLLKKAKKAGRKLMQKLGIGKKKDKQGKEERSKEEMETDLKMGIKEANDKIDAPVTVLKAELAPLKALKGVTGFDYKKGRKYIVSMILSILFYRQAD